MKGGVVTVPDLHGGVGDARPSQGDVLLEVVPQDNARQIPSRVAPGTEPGGGVELHLHPRRQGKVDGVQDRRLPALVVSHQKEVPTDGERLVDEVVEMDQADPADAERLAHVRSPLEPSSPERAPLSPDASAPAAAER